MFIVQPWHNINAMKETNHFLIDFKASIDRWNLYLVLLARPKSRSWVCHRPQETIYFYYSAKWTQYIRLSVFMPVDQCSCQPSSEKVLFHYMINTEIHNWSAFREWVLNCLTLNRTSTSLLLPKFRNPPGKVSRKVKGSEVVGGLQRNCILQT